jgi:hypothetical protein
VLVATLLLAVLLGGCFTGPRPSEAEDPFPPGASSGSPEIDQVLALLDTPSRGPYTARYSVLTKYGNTKRPATVAVDGDRRSVTVGDVRFITVGGTYGTCLLNSGQPCSTTIDAARISDTQLTPNFYGVDAAKRLRRDATSIIGTPMLHVEQTSGQQATCVDVPLPGGTAVFCAMANGPLTRLDDAAVSISMTDFTTTVDESLFAFQP